MYWIASNGSVGEATPPDDMILMNPLPARSSRRAARRTASGPSATWLRARSCGPGTSTGSRIVTRRQVTVSAGLGEGAPGTDDPEGRHTTPLSDGLDQTGRVPAGVPDRREASRRTVASASGAHAERQLGGRHAGETGEVHRRDDVVHVGIDEAGEHVAAGGVDLAVGSDGRRAAVSTSTMRSPSRVRWRSPTSSMVVVSSSVPLTTVVITSGLPRRSGRRPPAGRAGRGRWWRPPGR